MKADANPRGHILTPAVGRFERPLTDRRERSRIEHRAARLGYHRVDHGSLPIDRDEQFHVDGHGVRDLGRRIVCVDPLPHHGQRHLVG